MLSLSLCVCVPRRMTVDNVLDVVSFSVCVHRRGTVDNVHDVVSFSVCVCAQENDR